MAVKPRLPHAQRGDSAKAGAALAAQKLTVEAASQRQWWGDNPALQQQIPRMLQAGAYSEVCAVLREQAVAEAPITQFFLAVVRRRHHSAAPI